MSRGTFSTSLATCALALAACSDNNTNQGTSGGNDAGIADGGGGADAAGSPDASADAGAADVSLGPDAGAGATFEAHLSGAEEVPTTTSTATGVALFTLGEDGTTLTYAITQNVRSPTAAHIHRAQAGVSGPVLVPLAKLDGTAGTVTLTAEDRADLEAGRLYVNIHTAANPAGAIRGQILRPNESLFVAHLTGAEEVPVTTSTATGALSLIRSADGESVRFELTTNAPITAAHIHSAIGGQAGGVVYPLATAEQHVRGTIAVEADDLEQLENGEWYVNVHTAAHPAGEIRGQIMRPGEKLFVATLTAAQETPPTNATSTGAGELILDFGETNLRFYVTTTAEATAAHVHAAPGGVAGPVVFSLGSAGAEMKGVHAVTPEDVAALKRGRWYFNVHTAESPGGAIRGQLLTPGERLYTAALTGAAETPPVTTTASGGIGFIVSADRGSLRYEGSFSMLTATAAHIHKGGVGVAGPVVHPLTITGSSLSGDQAITSTDLDDLEDGGLYANVHSAAHPGGEIRGQILRR